MLQSRSASTLRLFSVVIKVDPEPICSGVHFFRPQSSFPFLADNPRRLRRLIHAQDLDSRPPKTIELSSILTGSNNGYFKVVGILNEMVLTLNVILTFNSHVFTVRLNCD